MNIDTAYACDHDQDPGDQLTCLIADPGGLVHQVRSFRDRCECHGTALADIEGRPE